jgi:glycosyltransferase involved in cell wall biosynthesis
MDEFSVIVVTHNRASLLEKTLEALARMTCRVRWEVLVVDNNSTDETRAVVTAAVETFPIPLRYVFEGTPGKYWALNTGIAEARGQYLAATDDDAYPEPDWLDRALDGFERFNCDFVGGPVYPVWRGSPPSWLDTRSAIGGKVLGLLDHGPRPREFGRDGISWPLGVNVAYRREAFDRAGPFDGRLGRVAGTLRNQSQREWHLRARHAGLRGMYLPDMVVHHTVDSDRLTRRYFHRWFYWHGISRAILYNSRGLHLLNPEDDGSHAGERHVLGVPRSLWHAAVRSSVSAGKRWLLGRSNDALQYEVMVCFWAGVLRQRIRDRFRLAAAPPRPLRTAPVTPRRD